MAGVLTLLLCLLAVAVSANAIEHTVGDSDGWAFGVDYDAWASSKTFVVGDTLLFKYGYPLHTVTEVSESDYNDCSDTNAIKTYTDQNTKIALTKPGIRYFICSTPGHCFGGMKIAVIVSTTGNTMSHPPKTSMPSTLSPSPAVAEAPHKELTTDMPPSLSSSSTAKLPSPTATNGATIRGVSIEQKAFLLVVLSLFCFELMG